MMKYINIIFLIVLSMSMAQCKSDEDEPEYPRPDWSAVPEDFANSSPNWVVSNDVTISAPGWSVDLSGSDAAPSWSDPDKSVYPTSMTAVLRLSPVLETFAADGDAMAAFIGGECRGVAQVVMLNGVKLFFVQVKASSSESGNVEFRYYSSRFGRIYKSVASDVPYVINKVYGTADAPAYPNFEQSGKYPCLTKAYVKFDAVAALPFNVENGDEVAAFVGNDCRSITHVVDAASGAYWFDVFGLNAGETFRIKYYSAANKCAYISEQSFVMPATGGAVGSIDAPEALTFVPDGSMTAYITIGSPLSGYTDAAVDEVAAFANGNCIGKGEYLGNSVYKLVMKGLVPDATNIEVKYYCSKCSYIFSSPAFFTFASVVLGSELRPIPLDLILDGKHPLKMKAYILPKGMVKDLIRDTDIMAAFVGNECRGVAEAKTTDSGQLYFMVTINGSIEGNEKVTLKYYSGVKKQLYESNTTISFVADSEYGTVFSPRAVEFTR